MPTEEEQLGFLSRWSRRKRGEEVVEPTPEPPLPAIAETAPPESLAECPVEEAPAAEPEFDVASLPPVETLDANSDFTLFLKPGVPQALRTAALRKAWTADPLIRDYMSSLDYAWDFNTPGGLPYGFSNVLAETGEALRKLISQAIGEIEPEEEKPDAGEAEPILLAEMQAELTALGEDGAEVAPPLIEAPMQAIRLSEAPAPPVSLPVEEPPPPPRRRHGGAIPA